MMIYAEQGWRDDLSGFLKRAKRNPKIRGVGGTRLFVSIAEDLLGSAVADLGYVRRLFDYMEGYQEYRVAFQRCIIDGLQKAERDLHVRRITRGNGDYYLDEATKQSYLLIDAYTKLRSFIEKDAFDKFQDAFKIYMKCIEIIEGYLHTYYRYPSFNEITRRTYASRILREMERREHSACIAGGLEDMQPTRITDAGGRTYVAPPTFDVGHRG
jgi:hypothetical protein